MACDYTTKRLSNFKEHLKSKRHMKAEHEYKKNSTYICEPCGFYTNLKSYYNTHLTTKKHLEFDDNNRNIVSNDIIPTNVAAFFKDLMVQNQYFQKSIVEVCTEVCTEVCKTVMQSQCNITNQSHNTNSHNTQNFNINIFLNETCKDAMNINEFIESLKIDSDVIENLGRDGYVEGMTKIFVDGLGQMQVQRRPIHCTDVKRETFYIRDDNEWLKDQDNKRIESAINRVVRKNQSNLHLWREKNPQYDTMNTPEYEFYIEIMKQCIGGGQEKEVINNRKIIRNLAKFTAVDKSLML